VKLGVETVSKFRSAEKKEKLNWGGHMDLLSGRKETSGQKRGCGMGKTGGEYRGIVSHKALNGKTMCLEERKRKVV